ncbi:protein phosphatase 1 regulatory subunit 27-like [Actinia tenebrosa]|uniref:Protein phosphatase 1 regulatory subunit 27-like n=1 Tax=Actinia tenebrosa TaxID=6105 RepID=A0A6P8IUG3_ACTTE|nr:protein phosphatase 1 regulatory subunit 27-like [Actinia tenebrosa]
MSAIRARTSSLIFQESPTKDKKAKTAKGGNMTPIDLILLSRDFFLMNGEPEEKLRLRKMFQGCNVDQITATGVTALTQSALDGRLENIKLLIELGADVNKKDRFGWTPLHYAVSEGYDQICRYLLNHGANARIENAEGEFPVELADQENIASLMLDATINMRRLSVED